MSYQTRSTRTDALLLSSLQRQGLDVQEVDACEHHPDFTVGGWFGWVRATIHRMWVAISSAIDR